MSLRLVSLTLGFGSAALRPLDRADLAALAAAAEEPVLAVGFETGDEGAFRHDELLLDRAGLGVDAAELALIAFPGRVPELAIDPGDAGHMPVGLDRAQDLAGRGIDLVDLAVVVLADPERALGPGQAGIFAVARRWDPRQHAAGLRVDLLNLLLGDLVEMRAVEGGAGMGRDMDRSHDIAAPRIDR